MTHKKPAPLTPGVPRKHCPVCGEVSYSQAGIHPQCSQLRSEPQRLKRVKREMPLPSEEEVAANKPGRFRR